MASQSAQRWERNSHRKSDQCSTLITSCRASTGYLSRKAEKAPFSFSCRRK